MITNQYVNNKKATRKSLAFTTALCLTMGAFMGGSAFGMKLEDNDVRTTAKQLRKTLKNSPKAVSKKFQQYIQECKVQKNKKDFISVGDDTVFILSGSIVGVSDINKNLAKNPQCSVFCVYTDYFLFDENLKKQGATFLVDAPHWFVMGKKTINLEGEQGKDHRWRKASNGNNSGAHGSDGLPGNSGKNGGHFYGIGSSFDNLKSLTINVSGGRGGKGQDGGNGANGADGIDGDENNFENAGENNFRVDLQNLVPGDLAYRKVKTPEETHPGWYGKVEPGDLAYGNKGERIAKKICTYDNEKFRELYQNGERGKAGGNAGAGGEGGKSGEKGSIIIDGESLQPHQYIQTETNGIDGSPGSPGLGGKDGTLWQRTYINECPATSGINPVKFVASLISVEVNSNWENNPIQINNLQADKEERAADGAKAENRLNRLDDKNIIKSQNTILKPLELLQQAHIKQIETLKRNAQMAIENDNISKGISDLERVSTYDLKKKNLSRIIAELRKEI